MLTKFVKDARHIVPQKFVICGIIKVMYMLYIIMCVFYMNFLLQNQRTPLHIAVYRDNVSLVKKLISFGADINTKIVSRLYACATKKLSVSYHLYGCVHIMNYLIQQSSTYVGM